MTADRTDRTWNAWTWLMLATIVFHALAPVGSPLARTNGSPFSASTIEVSTAPKRATPVANREKIDDPDPGAAPAWPVLGGAAAPAVPDRQPQAARPDYLTADPLVRAARLRPLGARAPPAA